MRLCLSLFLSTLVFCSLGTRPIVCLPYSSVIGKTYYIQSTTANCMETWKFFRDSIILYQDWWSPTTQESSKYQATGTGIKFDSLEVVFRKKYKGTIISSNLYTIAKEDWRYYLVCFDQYVPGTGKEVDGFGMYQEWFIWDTVGCLSMGTLDRESEEQEMFIFSTTPQITLKYNYDFGE